MTNFSFVIEHSMLCKEDIQLVFTVVVAPKRRFLYYDGNFKQDLKL